jgi:hypothetical protein
MRAHPPGVRRVPGSRWPAFAAGVGESEIFRLTGITRTTIDWIVTQAGDGPRADTGEGGTP